MRDSFLALAISSMVAHVALGDLVITEIMQNPDKVSDTFGEFFEILNTGAGEVDLSGYIFSDNDSDSFEVVGLLPVAAGERLVFGASADTVLNGGVDVDYEFGSEMALANGDDELVMMTPDSTEIDRVEWDGGTNFPDPTGASMSLTNPGADNNDGTNWFEANILTYGDGDFGTPGTQNEDIVFVTVSAIPDTVQIGGTADFDVTLENPTNRTLTYDAWIRAEGGVIDRIVLSRPNLSLPSEIVVTRPISLQVPGVAPPGDYKVSVNVGNQGPNTVFWSDSFDVPVIP